MSAKPAPVFGHLALAVSSSHLELKEPGFLGIAEILARLDRQRSTIVEYPTTLLPRKLGYSKMKTFRTIPGHLRLLAGLALGHLGRLAGYIGFQRVGRSPANDRGVLTRTRG